MNDAELLHEYASDQSESAFRALVERHLPLVYSAAVRQAGQPALVESLTTAVFILLARRSSQLPPQTSLADWLFRKTRQVMAKSRRGEQCQRRRGPGSLNRLNSQPTDVWEQVGPLLDEALAQLSDAERGAVLLHYLQNRRLWDVGQALGISEDTAQKRIARAIRKLRKLLLKRGVDLPVVALPGLLMTHGAQVAPSYLVASVTAAALNQVAVSTQVYALLQGATRESVWPRVNTALRRIAALAVITAVVIYLWPHRTSRDSSAYSFETKITMRPPYVAPPPSVLATARAPATSPANEVARTNTPSPAPQQVAVVRSQPAVTNTIWPPGVTVAALTAPPPGPSVPVEQLAVVPPSEPDPPAQPVAWNSPYPLAYPPAQNIVRIGGGFGPIYTTNATAWIPAQSSGGAKPPPIRAPMPPSIPKRR